MIALLTAVALPSALAAQSGPPAPASTNAGRTPAPTRASTSPVPTRSVVVLPVHVHTVHADGRPIAPPDWIARRIARANEIFAPYGVAFQVLQDQPLAAAHAALMDRADRDALASYAGRGAIDCFVVDALADVDEAGRMRRGVHWRARTSPGAHYVIVSLLGNEDVLAHELGHYLGNPEHSDTPGNLMSYEHTEVLPFLDPPQQARLQRALRGYQKRGELVPLSDSGERKARRKRLP